MSKWINVKDKLPEHKGDYLVYEKWIIRGRISDSIEIVYFRGKSYWAKSNENITHWMPLPEKPKNK